LNIDIEKYTAQSEDVKGAVGTFSEHHGTFILSLTKYHKRQLFVVSNIQHFHFLPQRTTKDFLTSLQKWNVIVRHSTAVISAVASEVRV